MQNKTSKKINKPKQTKKINKSKNHKATKITNNKATQINLKFRRIKKISRQKT